MNYEVFLSDITRKVLATVSLQRINQLLRVEDYGASPSQAMAEINSAVNHFASEKLKELSNEQVKKVATGFNFNRENYLNTMHATIDEPGFIYAISTIELAICDYVINYNKSLNQTDKKVEEKTDKKVNEKVDENIFVK